MLDAQFGVWNMNYELFERDFIVRTLDIIRKYEKYVPQKEQFEVTLLINCLLGLLILPKERCYINIPKTKINELIGWGLSEEHIISWGDRPRSIDSNYHETVLEVVHKMRNSIAHLRVIPISDNNEIKSLQFSDRSGFEAIVPVECLHKFVAKLSESIDL